MRQRLTAQSSIFESYAKHETGNRLKALSEILDRQPEILLLIEKDIQIKPKKNTGRRGMSVESIFRCLLLKQELQISYKQLSFLLCDSTTYHTFARLDGLMPKRSSLQNTIRQIKPETLEKINVILMKHWIDTGAVSCKQLRIDATVTKANIAPPSDSSLLEDGIRVLSRLLSKSKDETGIKIRFTDKRKPAKSLAFRIFNAKKQGKDALYPDLIKMAHLVSRQADKAKSKVVLEAENTPKAKKWLAKVDHYQKLVCKVIDQTQRRIFNEESVPASEKIVSIFEEHTDIIIKGDRDVHYGHKINLSTTAGGFVTHLTIENGNPKDSTLYLPVLSYHKKHFTQEVDDVACDGCYASKNNAYKAREMGVKRAVFSKHAGLTLHEMGVKQKTLKRLKNFRAGVEGNISELKRRFGLSKSLWKKHDGFKAFVWASTLMYNLTHMVRMTM